MFTMHNLTKTNMSLIVFLLFFACFSCVQSNRTARPSTPKSVSKAKKPISADQIVYSFVETPKKPKILVKEPEYGFYGIYDTIGPNPYKYSSLCFCLFWIVYFCEYDSKTFQLCLH